MKGNKAVAVVDPAVEAVAFTPDSKRLKRFTLYAETKGNIRELAEKYFDGFTLIEGTGVWKGNIELSTQVVILAEDGPEIIKSIHDLAQELKTINGQESVYVTADLVDGYLA